MERQGRQAAVGTRSSSVKMSIAAEIDLVRPVRLAVGGVAALGDFTIEEVEDLQLAANELLAIVIAAVDRADIDIEMGLGDNGEFLLEARSTSACGTVDRDALAVSERVISVLADSHDIELGDGVVAQFVRYPDSWGDEDAQGLGATN